MSASTAGMVKREGSGLVVPAALASEVDATTGKTPTAYDPDGRRRVVLSTQDQKAIDRGITTLRQHGLGVIVACASRDDGKPICGQPLLVEGKGLPTAGYGCRCSRVHFI